MFTCALSYVSVNMDENFTACCLTCARRCAAEIRTRLLQVKGCQRLVRACVCMRLFLCLSADCLYYHILMVASRIDRSYAKFGQSIEVESSWLCLKKL